MIEPFWWCDHCMATKSPLQVNFDETCTLCRSPVVWIDTPELAEEHGIDLDPES